MLAKKRKLPLFIVFGCCLAAVAWAQSQPARRGVSVIVVLSESAAAEIHSRLQSGTSFETLAATYSADSTASRAGYMGMVDESELRQEFKAALKGLKAGAVSAVTRVGNSFVLLKWTTSDEDSWRSQHDSALSALQQGRYPEASSHFLDAVRRAEKLGKEDIRLAESLNGLADVYQHQQNYVEAAARARRSLGILERAFGPLDVALIPSLSHLAAAERATGRYAEAEQIYRRILSTRWGASEAASVGADQVLEQLAEVLILAHMQDPALGTALEDFWLLISKSRLEKNLYVRMRDRLLSASLVAEAESLMQRAIRLHPDSRQLRYELGELYATWGKYQKAIDIFDEATRIGVSPDAALDRQQRGMLLGRIAEMHFVLVQFDEALTAATAALELSPAVSGPRLLIGTLHQRRSKFDEAAAQYQRVISADSRNAEAHEGLAQVHLAAGRYTDAVNASDKALEIDPGRQSALYVKATALIRHGRLDEGRAALHEFERRQAETDANAANESELASLERASAALMAEARLQEALELLVSGIRSFPGAASLHLRVAVIHARLGFHKEAARVLETMIQLKTGDFLVHRRLSREYDVLGNSEGRQQQRVLYLERYDAALQEKVN